MQRSLLLGLTCLALGVVQAQPPDQLEAVVTTEAGSFRFEFAPDKAPRHVEQFIRLARQGYYNGSAFHLMVAGGLVLGGDPLLKDAKTPRTLWGTGGMNLLKGELSDLKHERGVVSSVRIPEKPDSDGAQFFVCVNPQPTFDGKYSTFGRITEGIDVVERLSTAPVDARNMAEKPIRIVSVTIEPKRQEPFLNASLAELGKTVVLKTTLGEIKLKMEPGWAPEHARNFLKLAQTGWYNGTAFHRIAKDFVVQGGLSYQRSSGQVHPADRWVRKLKAEFRDDVKHTRGIVSMAHGEDPDSADTSFFLVLADAAHLDGKYTAFARIVEGLDVLAAFEKEEVDGETPRRRLEIISVTVE